MIYLVGVGALNLLVGMTGMKWGVQKITQLSFESPNRSWIISS